MTLLTYMGVASLAFVMWFTWRAATGAQTGAGQSRRESIIEAWINIVIGFSVNFAANLVLIPLMADGHHVSAAANWWGGWVYTSISILRQYAIRRWANDRLHILAARLARRQTRLFHNFTHNLLRIRLWLRYIYNR